MASIPLSDHLSSPRVPFLLQRWVSSWVLSWCFGFVQWLFLLDKDLKSPHRSGLKTQLCCCCCWWVWRVTRVLCVEKILLCLSSDDWAYFLGFIVDLMKVFMALLVCEGSFVFQYGSLLVVNLKYMFLLTLFFCWWSPSSYWDIYKPADFNQINHRDCEFI